MEWKYVRCETHLFCVVMCGNLYMLFSGRMVGVGKSCAQGTSLPFYVCEVTACSFEYSNFFINCYFKYLNFLKSAFSTCYLGLRKLACGTAVHRLKGTPKLIFRLCYFLRSTANRSFMTNK